MPRLIAFMTACIMASFMASAVQAEHAKINLEVATRARQRRGVRRSDSARNRARTPGPSSRPRSTSRSASSTLLTNVYPHKTLENVVVHFLSPARKRSGRKSFPDLKGDVVIETAFDMDFKPGGKAGQRSTVKIDAPGVYLIRLETRNTQSDHEHFAAIDLVVDEQAKP